MRYRLLQQLPRSSRRCTALRVAPTGGEHRGFRQCEPQQGHDHQSGDAADDEHHAPVRDDHEREQRRQHGADVIAGHREGDGPATAVRRREFADAGDRRRQARTEAESGDEAEDSEDEDTRGTRNGEGAEGEDEHTDDERPPSPVGIGQRPDQERADSDTHQADRRDDRRRGRVEAELTGAEQCRNDRAEHDEVEAVECDHDPAEDRRPIRVGSERTHGASLLSACTRQPLMERS